MNRFKDFGSSDLSAIENPSFALYGETFTAKKALQGRMLLALVAKSGNENPAESAQAIGDFFSHALLEESAVRFNALLEHPEKVDDVEKLGEIIGWLVEVYTNRPTVRSEVLSNGA